MRMLTIYRKKHGQHGLYSRIRIEVKEQKADGSMSATVTGAWDVKENRKV